MALITDPDLLSQGASTTVSDAVWGTPSGAVVAITSAGTNLPAFTAGEYFEIRDHSNANNNGLYKESGGSPSTGSITATKITGTNPAAAGSESVAMLGNNGATINKKSVHYDSSTRKIYLLENGNLSSDGVSLQALYSFTKEEWKNDSTLIPHPFPFTAITPEQFEFNYDWTPTDVVSPVIQTRKLIRTGGWREFTTANVLNKEYAGIVTLGQFEDNSNDQAYYQVGSDPTDTSAGVAFTFNGPVNEAINTYNYNVGPNASLDFDASTITRGSGSWITDGYKKGSQVTITNAEDAGNNGTYVITAVTATDLTVTGITFTTNADDDTATLATNYRNAVKLFLRIRDGDTNGKTFAQSQLSDIGVTAVDNKVFRFPVSNATDLKITATDATITGGAPYTQIVLKYFDQAFSQDVDTPGTGRNFGIVIDVGTHSGVDGACSSGGTSFTTAEAGITGANYTAGTLIIHEGLNKGSYTISGTPAAGTVTITGSTFPSTVSNQSFTLQRATPIDATAEQIYAKVQYLLRQASDIDTTDQTVTGTTADALLRFVGDTLEAGQAIPSNPNGGGSGVNIQGFSSNDTNRITLYDNTGASRTFPFVAAGAINFNANLVSDGSAKYWMFFEYTERFTNTGFSIGSSSGSTATLSSTTTNLTTELASGDYITLSGFANSANNGVYLLTASPAGSGPYTVAVRKINGATLVNETAGATVLLDKNPINSPDAIVVQDGSDADITGTIGGASVSFTFDYDGNTQGGRTASTDAAVVVRAIGLSTAQFVETSATITRATGQSISLVSSLERNYAT
jgi:hypothetical protein